MLETPLKLHSRTTRSAGRPLPNLRMGWDGPPASSSPITATVSARTRSETSSPGLEHPRAWASSPRTSSATPTPALANAGVSLQALMVLLGQVSAQMSLRYGQLFDRTIRTEYERTLDLAKAHIGPMNTSPTTAGRTTLPLVDISHEDWRETPTIKARMAGGYCLRAPAQEACPYANICEHCPS